MVEGSATGLPISEVAVVQPTPDIRIEPGTASLSLGSSAPEVKVAIPNVRQDVWNLDEGPVVLHYPAKMSAASFEDFEAWINLQLKKIKRGIDQ